MFMEWLFAVFVIWCAVSASRMRRAQAIDGGGMHNESEMTLVVAGTVVAVTVSHWSHATDEYRIAYRHRMSPFRRSMKLHFSILVVFEMCVRHSLSRYSSRFLRYFSCPFEEIQKVGSTCGSTRAFLTMDVNIRNWKLSPLDFSSQ